MSNDVHLTTVNNLQKSISATDDDFIVINHNRCMLRGSLVAAGESNLLQVDKNQRQTAKRNEELEFLSSNKTAYSGVVTMQQQQLLRHEVESSPDHTQRDTNESDNNISSCSTLDIVNKMDNVTLQHLETQVRELSQRLQNAEMERSDMQQQLQQVKAEKELCFRRMEVISAAHECRLTEMHCVIAELSKKLRAKQENTIIEEQEPEGSEISYQECSVYNSELSNPDADAECQTDPLDAEESDVYADVTKFGHPIDDSCRDLNEDIKLHKSAITKGQVEALQEEVLHLKAQIALLQSEIANSLCLDQPVADTNNKLITTAATTTTTEDMLNIIRECDDVAHQVQETCNFAYNSGEEVEVETNSKLHYAQDQTLNTQKDMYFNQADQEILTSSQKITPVITKLAERVKLRDKNEISMEDAECNALVPEEQYLNPMENQKHLRRHVKQLKLKNTILSLTLDECKEHCEHLYLLCGKYESNAIGLQLAVNCSDRAIEAYDVMLALLESKLALMLDKTTTAEDNRKAVESVARHLLDRLESEKDVCEHSLGPWQNTFSILDKKCSPPWTTDDDNRLRYHVSKLKACRATVQNTIVQLESPFCDAYEKALKALENMDQQFKEHDCLKRDSDLTTTHKELEMAILTQELFTVHEENVALKEKLDNAECERKFALQQKAMLQEDLAQLRTQLYIMAEANTASGVNVDNNKCRSSDTDAERMVALTELNLKEALKREHDLEGSIQTLYEKHEELHNTVCELKKTNQNLTHVLEQNKRKYHLRMRKLEQRIMELSMEAGRQQTALTMQAAQHNWEQESYNVKCKNNLSNQHVQLHKNDVPETTL